MQFITDIQPELALHNTIGGKARNLYRLKKMGLMVPKWIVIPKEELLTIIPLELQQAPYDEIIKCINACVIPLSVLSEITQHFQATDFFAVRSSAIDEDGTTFSFAGQFESYLFVTKENLAEKIKAVWCSAFSERVYQYRKNNRLFPEFGIAVIIQEMIQADCAGVAFGIDPTTGDRKAKVISAVYGLGEGLVSGELNSDNFILKGNHITAQLADKTEQIVFDPENKSGTKKIAVEEWKRKKASLNNDQLLTIAGILDHCNKEYGKPQDMEFAVGKNEVYILQSRPITGLTRLADKTQDYRLWDNSNIIESYPGITTPLTFSFICKSYEGAYKLFCEFLGVDKKTIKEQERIFSNTLGLINGSVYYNLKTWYQILAMLPGYRINARFMEKMMGVKERFDLPQEQQVSIGRAWWNTLKMMINMYRVFKFLPQRRKQFVHLLNATIEKYKKINYEELDASAVMQCYIDFEKTLLNEWKAPLLNDFFAMIWFGLLQKRCEKYKVSNNPNIHNDLLCGSNDIISIQPIHRTIALATTIQADKDLRQLFVTENEQAIWEKVSAKTEKNYKALKKELDNYINDFGERCIGELKLETISFTQNPELFIKVLKSYVENGITADKTSGAIEEELRIKAEQEVNERLKGKFFKKWVLKRTLANARVLVSSRENLRYERTRAFGIVREIFSQLGKKFYAEDIIENDRDIFYLTKEEIFSFIEGTAVTQDIKGLICLRKKEFSHYKDQQTPSERFATYGTVYHANDFFSTGKIEVITGDLKGVGCCPGRVRGKVRVIRNANEVTGLNGDILVTSSTDPGWVTLFPSASAIIVERGSLLSHSAIVSREMGKPCIVGVSGLLRTLQTGDEVEMDGGSGEIKIIQKACHEKSID